MRCLGFPSTRTFFLWGLKLLVDEGKKIVSREDGAAAPATPDEPVCMCERGVWEGEKIATFIITEKARVRERR